MSEQLARHGVPKNAVPKGMANYNCCRHRIWRNVLNGRSKRVERLETAISTMSALTNSVRLHRQTSTASLTRTEAERRVLQHCSTTRSREQTCPLTYHTITDDTPTLTLLPCTAHERILQSTNNGITDSGQGQISQFYDFSKCSYSLNLRDVPCLGPHNYV